MHSNTTRLPSIDVTPGECGVAVLTLVQLGREKLRRHHDSMLGGARVIVFLGTFQSSVHNGPVPITIAITAMEHHICVRHLLFIYMLGKVSKKIGASMTHFNMANL